jgi:YfiH family protein
MARIFYSSRHLGNLATHVGDDPQNVAVTRANLALLLSTDEVIFMNQTHSNRVMEVSGIRQEIYDCDALITSEKNLHLAVMVADCIPLLISSTTYVAAVHVGRPGLVGRIATHTINAMKDRGAIDFTAIIGPSVCANCYEVAPEMYAEVSAEFPATATSPEKHALNLQSGLRAELEALGVQVEELHICTKESSDYFSYRREKETGRQVGVVAL